MISIRPFTIDDAAGLREMRLTALLDEPGVFAARYERSVAQTAEFWQSLAAGDDEHQVFGLFDGDTLIGITAVFKYDGDERGETAVFAMSYIEPAHREGGLSKRLYEARLEWVAARPAFTTVRVSHRRSNEVSRRANQRFGFTLVNVVEAEWPDGTVDDELIYELRVNVPQEKGTRP